MLPQRCALQEQEATAKEAEEKRKLKAKERADRKKLKSEGQTWSKWGVFLILCINSFDNARRARALGDRLPTPVGEVANAAGRHLPIVHRSGSCASHAEKTAHVTVARRARPRHRCTQACFTQ